MPQSSAPKINESVIYRSIGGDPWGATITRVYDDGLVDLELTGPFLKEPFALTAVHWSENPNETKPGARPKGTQNEEETKRI
jgi:hypothetical protein